MLILAAKDPLTGINNARSYYKICEQLINKAHSENTKYSAFFVDIDYFKKINDIYGHNVGDMVLQGVAKIITASVRQADLLARDGGEDFVVLATCADARQAEELAHRIRQAVAAHSFVHEGQTFGVTISIGVAVDDMRETHAQAVSADDALLQLVIRADKALYAAKAAGRNAVMVAP